MTSLPLTDLNTYRLLGNSGLRVSPLCLGTMTFGTEWGWGADKDESRKMFDAYAERGGNFVDTANFYTGGTSEAFIAEFMEGRRDRFVLATKYTLNMRPGDPNAGGNHRKSLVQSLEASLKRLNTEYVDLLWLHAWDFTTPVEEIVRALDDSVRAGKVLYVGISNPPAWIAARANTIAALRGWTPFIGLQVQYSMAERAVERELVPMAIEMGMGVTPWSPLAGGMLTGKYARAGTSATKGQKNDLDDSLRRDSNQARVTERNLAIVAELEKVAGETRHSSAQVALNWLLKKPGVTSIILGARTSAQLENNLGCIDFSLGDEQMSRLDEVSAIELGYPHDFLKSSSVTKYVFGDAKIES